jgi:UDP-glucose 4-epimerase
MQLELDPVNSSSSSNTRILILGGNGYVGRHLLEVLSSSNYQIELIDKNLDKINKSSFRNAKFHQLDLSKKDGNLKEILRNFEGKTIVVHLAAYKSVTESIINPKIYYDNNLQITKNVIDGIKGLDSVSIIFSSSAAVYGNTDPIVTEISMKSPMSPYAMIKAEEEQLLSEAAKTIGFNLTIFRFFNIIGAASNDLMEFTGENIIPRILNAIINKETFNIFGYSYPTPDGTAIRDYVDVRDVCSAIVKAVPLTANKSLGILNLSTGSGASVIEVIKEFEKLVNLKYKMLDSREGDMPILVGVNDRARELLSWEPMHKYKDSIASVWSSYISKKPN